LHGQLRDGTRAPGDLPRTIEHPSVPSIRELPPASVRESRAAGPSGIPAKWAAAVVVLGIAAIVASIFGWRLQSQVKTATDRARISEFKADAAVADLTRQAQAVRQDAEKQMADMRELTARAQLAAGVAAAPDLIRFNLSGANGASGQALFSRSRGVVVNGWRLPPLPANTGYQAWLLTRTTPVKAGILTADANGTAMLAQSTPTVPRAVVGVMVTAETAEGETPSGAPVLTSVVTAPQPPVAEQP
jgi:hypothetical protein